MSRTMLTLLLLCFPMAVAADTIHVPGDQPTIQAGIDAAVDGDTVIVADGVWTGVGNRDLVFYGKEVSLLAANGPAYCTIDCQGSEAEPHRAFSFEAGEGPLSMVQGFTITGGYADKGGAIICDAASPTILDCVITGNIAELRGGGVSCHYASAAVISGCTIAGNSVPGTTSNNGGGGISLIHQCAVRLEDSRIEGNSGHYGGGIKVRSGCSMEIEDCVITGNQAERGGGLACISNNGVTLTNCLVAGNTTTGSGGGFYLFTDYGVPSPLEFPARTDLFGCTLADNDSPGSGGGIYIGGRDDVELRSAVSWGNGPDQIYSDPWSWGDLIVEYSDVEGGVEGAGNIDEEPLFVTGPLGGYYLSQTAAGQTANSPCLDAGDPSAALPDGTTRTDSVQDAGVVDMGYHYALLDTVTADLGSVPDSGVLPFTSQFSVTLGNVVEYHRTVAGRINLILAGGATYQSWRAGYTNLGPNEMYVTSWMQTLPALGSLVGANVFELHAEDVTPPPFNQPPYPPSGDTATASCTVTGIAP